MKPGPATSVRAISSWSMSDAATFSAISRGGRFACDAAAIAPLHWNWARSGRCEGTTSPKLASRPWSAKASPTISLRCASNDIS